MRQEFNECHNDIKPENIFLDRVPRGPTDVPKAPALSLLLLLVVVVVVVAVVLLVVVVRAADCGGRALTGVALFPESLQNSYWVYVCFVFWCICCASPESLSEPQMCVVGKGGFMSMLSLSPLESSRAGHARRLRLPDADRPEPEGGPIMYVYIYIYIYIYTRLLYCIIL